MARRDVYNKNEKAQRNKEIFMEREEGGLIVEIAQRYGLSIPRIHRIVMQEENKALKEKVAKQAIELQTCRRR
jgi:Mor family transcriptional regulator